MIRLTCNQIDALKVPTARFFWYFPRQYGISGMPTTDSSFYARELTRIKEVCYGNPTQLDAVRKVRRYLDSDLQADSSLEHLSRVGFCSKFHLLRLFRKYYGDTPAQYLTAQRLLRSRALLAKGYTVTEACYEVGFKNVSSFSTLFRRRYGLSPGHFAKKSNFDKVAKRESVDFCGQQKNQLS